MTCDLCYARHKQEEYTQLLNQIMLGKVPGRLRCNGSMHLILIHTCYDAGSSGGSNPGLEGSSLLAIFEGERKGSSPWSGARAFEKC
jgi:hypothetical protein